MLGLSAGIKVSILSKSGHSTFVLSTISRNCRTWQPTFTHSSSFTHFLFLHITPPYTPRKSTAHTHNVSRLFYNSLLDHQQSHHLYVTLLYFLNMKKVSTTWVVFCSRFSSVSWSTLLDVHSTKSAVQVVHRFNSAADGIQTWCMCTSRSSQLPLSHQRRTVPHSATQ